MKHPSVKISLVLFTIGFIGVLSLLCTPFPLALLPEEALKEIPAELLQYLMLINPTIFLGSAIVLGHVFAPKVQLQTPLLTSIFLKKDIFKTFFHQLRFGLPIGILVGTLITMLSKVSIAYLPLEFVEMSQNFPQSLWTKFLYGGITEEIMLRWGVMSLVVWLCWQMAGSKLPVKPVFYLVGITVSALLFGIMHLPMALMVAQHPTVFLIAYIVGLNMIFGCAAGWLFWKKGLEASMIAHITVHVIFAVSPS